MHRYSLALGSMALGLLCAPLHAEETTLEQRLAAAEARLASLESRPGYVPKVDVNGFMTFAMERISPVETAAGNDMTYLGDIEHDDWNLNRLTRAGIQLNSQISDRAEAVVQLLGRASDDFNVDVQWAYVGYDIRPDLTARAGRFVLPFYLHSQYTQVGYAYPWIELPSEHYSVVPLDTMEGVDLTWNLNTGNVAHSINVFWGGMDVASEGSTFEVRNQHGINLRSNWGNWTGWYSYTNSEVTVDVSAAGLAIDAALNPPVGTGNDFGFSSFNMDSHYAYFTGVGLQYDNGRLFVMGERGHLDLSTPSHWFPTLDSGYITTGFRAGKWTPHVTWAYIEHSRPADVDTSVCAGPICPPAILFASFAEHQKSWTVGTRYDLATGIALKAEIGYQYDFGDSRFQTPGLYDDPVATTGTPDKGDPMVYRLAVESVF